jgi:uncharacterized protein with PIN domain
MTPDEIRFAADGMLQSLGTWLRLLGYDCIGDRNHWGRPLLEQAVAENRVFLTRNAHLNANLPHDLLARAIIFFVLAEHLPDQIREVTGKFALDKERFTFTRCVACNVPLLSTADMTCVPSDVAARETEFWHCPACGKTFWRGSHVRDSLTRLQKWLEPGQ